MINNKGRVCPNCKAQYKNANMTTCIKCGYSTIEKVVTKGELNADSLGKQLRPDRKRFGIHNTSEET